MIGITEKIPLNLNVDEPTMNKKKSIVDEFENEEEKEYYKNLITDKEITSINKIVYGPHLLRHTFVKNLLDAENPHQVITDSLGHISSKSDRYYISLEEEKLRECALGLDLIGTPLWEEE